jgi:hypothetical protein
MKTSLPAVTSRGLEFSAACLGQHVVRKDLVAILNHEVGSAGDQVTLVALGSLDERWPADASRRLLPQPPDATRSVTFIHFFIQGDAFLQILELNGAANSRRDGKGVPTPSSACQHQKLFIF